MPKVPVDVMGPSMLMPVVPLVHVVVGACGAQSWPRQVIRLMSSR